MLIKIIFTLLPTVFIALLFYTDAMQFKKGIIQDGTPPINKYFFFGSKYAVVLVWIAMMLEIWDIHIIGNVFENQTLKVCGIVSWVAGFSFLYIGRFSLGQSFRIGVANENTEFIVNGIYRISRNPMYLGLYLTFTGCMLYSLNVFYILLSIAIISIHHAITLAEEKQLINIYGESYKEYCKKVRRYL
jgi:protein-S-isoprenylcysteine O-methyltransferase Ste14